MKSNFDPFHACAALQSATDVEAFAETALALFTALGYTKVFLWCSSPNDGAAPHQIDSKDSSEVAASIAGQAWTTNQRTEKGGLVGFPLLIGKASWGALVVQSSGADPEFSTLQKISPTLALCIKQHGDYFQLQELVTAEISMTVERELAMQLVLDSIREGLLVCDIEGKITEVRSATIERWLGPCSDEQGVACYLGGEDQLLTQNLTLGFESLLEDFMPFELNTQQMPQVLERNNRTYSLHYEAVREGETLTQVVISVADITDHLSTQRAEEEQRELVSIIQAVVRSRAAFISFSDELTSLISDLLVANNAVLVKRLLHTVKGNSAIFGFHRFSKYCHQIEDRLENMGLGGHILGELPVRWQQELARVEELIDVSSAWHLTATREEFLHVLARVKNPDLRALLNDWQHEAVATLMAPQIRKAEEQAAAQGKLLKSTFVDSSTRVPSSRLRPFLLNLVHVLRNAVDHGLESPAEREAAGKPPVGTLRITTERSETHFRIALEDDGRGIDWETIARLAAKRSLPCTTHEQLVMALFADGLSAATSVTETSGRGVGLAALRAVCLQLGGRIEVTSIRGQGTCFEFVFLDMAKLQSLAPAA